VVSVIKLDLIVALMGGQNRKFSILLIIIRKNKKKFPYVSYSKINNCRGLKYYTKYSYFIRHEIIFKNA